ncbi:methyl-accepting chemotaxis protein [Pseudomonas sp. MDMC216]|jgi:methyl-accepting chemotaxis protein|uniref:Methyl-accepting chemotaxis protein n=2 Tax=Pseudomonadaceae TaxID=135621 RepID=A0A1H2L9Y0_9PSED|nr:MULTISPECIES: methyl-accepting chemotaxis protein [Pseudomonas]MBA4682643.1 methyl-accepting chemotaxis protein [Pseudomonas sp.]ERH48580.1 methyl-accepting chemotaxis protein [Pseudomonas chengduensis]KQO40876.1 chemotaxis protein [Pseudomonas sp. Leaf83]MBP3060677.1 HAMP domain-containing protein [Pseudomonas chengduensis]MDH0957306.1 methyl-accepting chemotaxis protein [Pseudomonas chengduensis]
MLRAFADLGFRWKIALPILLLAALLVAMGTLGVRGITQVAESSTTLTNRHLPAISLLLNADRDLYQAFVAERSLLDEGAEDHVAALKKTHAENLQQAYDRVHKFADMQPGSEALALVAEFDRGFERWKATSQRVLELASSDPEGASRLSFGDSEAQFEEARTAIDKLGELEDNAANAVGTDAIARGEALVWQQGLIIAIGLLVCLVLVVGFPLLVTRPLHNLLYRIEQIADGDGDLRVRLDVLSRDELGKLSHAFNRFLDKLQPLIKEVGRVTGEVADSAQSLAGMAAANDRLISSEHAAVDQVSTAATEMSVAVHEVARNAQNAADAARHAEVQSREGAQVVGATIHSIRQLAQEVESASDTIQTLEQETANIGAVLAVIKGIAEQTNLLALNAAIEAARAGEQGRGFAVVADEVRALAARTQESTKDIQQMIERLQAGVQNAVKATHSGSARARQSVEQAAGVDQALSVTGDSVQRINDMAAQIATACEEQSSVTEEIARNISDIRDLSNEAAQTSEQSTRASQHLSELSHGLAQLVGRFRV